MDVPEQVSVRAPDLARPRLMTQQWRDVAFLHWAVDPATIARFFPSGVRPDLLDGRTYVGLVPFRMVGAGFDERRYAMRLRWPARGTSRTAVRAGGPAPDGPLERFLTARWGLHVAHLGRTWYVPNAHPPWPLRTAELLTLDDGLVAAAGLGDLARRPPDHVAFSDGVAVRFGLPTRAARPRRGTG